MNDLRKRIFFILAVFSISFFLFEVVFADENDFEVNTISSEEVIPTSTPEPTITLTPTPTPSPTISPSPMLREETQEFYDDVVSGLKDANDNQMKILISIWGLTGLVVGVRVLKDVFG